MHFIVLSSSRGTTFQSTIEAMQRGDLTATCLGLITDRSDRGCIEKAKAAGIPVFVVEKIADEDRESYDKRVHLQIQKIVEKSQIANLQSPILAAMGWMFIFTPWFIGQWKNRIINVHPALLPKHGGKGMFGHHVHDAVLAAHETESGVTIHLMDEGVDTGKILVQKKCSVLPSDTSVSLQARVQELEKEWYPRVLEMIENGQIVLPDITEGKVENV
ncbi:MAG: phosphoribosylglycinamide formyltransferase [Candidatus Peregrinibacteria bacterium]